LDYFGKIIHTKTALIGEFQIYNAVMAIGLVIGMGIDANDLPIENIFENLCAPAGRAEFVGKTKTGGAVFVDYAHTPVSLEQIIESLRKHTTNRLHVLFGCGGNRDTGKRPMMGEIAAKNADIVYITDDNPRMEDATQIRKQIIAACPNGIEIANRAEAIHTAVNSLSDGDILIIAGKGHEDYQIIGKEKTHFSDKEEVLNTIASMK
ncbi:MAG: cyanophycin synthetase, partial [Alphaproteobacteria bacterium]